MNNLTWVICFLEWEEAYSGRQASTEDVPSPGDDEPIQDDAAKGSGGPGKGEGENETESQEDICSECYECCE